MSTSNVAYTQPRRSAKSSTPSTAGVLTTGSGIAFEDRGVQTLKGVPDEWRLYAVATPPSG